MTLTEYAQFDGLALAELVRTGEVTPAELTELAIGAIEALNPRLNAVIYTDFDGARANASALPADAPFSGVPFLLKDLVALWKDHPLYNGSRFLRDFVIDHDSELVARYKRAGLNILGRTNAPEFGLAHLTESVLNGKANNPWDLARNTGGSSGGAAAVVAAGILPIAHANDGGGSIRTPAACCGVFGMKPTRARTPIGPDIAIAWQGMAIEHAVSRTVRDSAALLDATAGPDVGAPYFPPPPERPYLEEVEGDPAPLRIAFSDVAPLGTEVHPDVKAAIRDAASLCESLGHTVEEAAPTIDANAFYTDMMLIIGTCTASDIRVLEEGLNRKAARGDFEIITRILAQLGRSLPAPLYEAASYRIRQTARQVMALHETYDVFLCPAIALPPPVHGELDPPLPIRMLQKLIASLGMGRALKLTSIREQLIRETFRFVPISGIQNVTGQPAMSVPLYWNEMGLPVGVQFAGRYGDESTLFRLAGQLERARPWAKRFPKVSVLQGDAANEYAHNL